MKNLPEKIYLNFGEITKEEFEADDYNEFCKLDEFAVTFCEDRVYDTDVEFVRKDAFIEKVINFLNYKLDDVVATRVPGTIIPHHVAKQELIDDLKKYMKEE